MHTDRARASAGATPPVDHAVSPSQCLEVTDGVGILHPRGRLSLVEATDLVSNAISTCRERGISRILVDSRDIVDLPIPSLIDRFLMAEDWAHAAHGDVCVCLVASPEYVHPQKFGVVVARHLGLTCNVHTSRDEAQAWLAGIAGQDHDG